MATKVGSLISGDVGRFGFYVLRRFQQDLGLQLAGSLTYTTLLALVPTSVVALSIIAGFPWFEPVREQMLTAMFSSLLPDTIESVREQFEAFAVNAGKLGFAALAGMAVTAVMMLSAVEGAFNTIWRVRDKRSLGGRLTIYWSFLTLGPILFGGSLTLSSYLFAVVNQAGIAGYVPPWVKPVALLPPLITWIGFFWLYFSLPNRPVRVVHALVGGLVAAALFEALKRLFAWYVQAFPSYQAIYGALAAVPILLLWTYLAWVVTLFGAVITASMPEWRHRARMGEGSMVGPAPRLSVALALLSHLRRGAATGRGLGLRELLLASDAPPDIEDEVLDKLVARNFIVRIGRNRCMLARDLSTVTLYDLVRALDLAPFGSDSLRRETWAQPFGGIVDRVDADQVELMSVTLDRLLAAPQAGLPETRTEPAAQQNLARS